jgi:hypothetical protein
MSPREVQGLQALAMEHGGSLTINPETGLPEAGFLDKLLPAIIGFALNAVAPGAGEAVAGLWGGAGGAAAGTAAIVGGVQTARTGSLAEGVQAGLGAYGGANLASGMASAGASQLAGEALLPAATEQAALEGITLPSNYADMAARSVTPAQIAAAKEAALASGSNLDVVSKGFDAASKNPMQFAKDNWRSLAGVAVPAILAGESVKSGMPQTVTKPGMIRPYSYDPYGGGYVAANPYEAQVKKAAGGGIMGFDESSNAPVTERNINNMQNTGGMFNYAGDGGGVMRMAEGGLGSVIRMAGGTPPAMLSDADLFTKTGSWEAAAAARDAQNNAMNQYTWQQQAAERDSAARAANITADAARLSGNTNTNANNNVVAPVDYNALATNYVTTAAGNPNITTSDFITGANTAKIGLTQPLATALQNSGLSAASQYALTHADIGPTANAEETYGGLKGLSSNINYSLAAYNADPANKNKTAAQKRADAIAAMSPYGLNEADVKRATGKSLSELFPTELVCGPGFKKSIDGLTCVPDTKVVTEDTTCPSGSHWDPTLKMCVLNTSATQGTTSNVTTPTDISVADKSTLPVGISGAGITTINPNGTVTTRPDIPGIPEGGFTGMTSLRKAYEDGGGSLGVNKNLFVPKTTKELEDRYKLTGGSKQSYDYLMGKTPYSPKPVTATGEVMKPYAESVLGMPVNKSTKMYLFDPDTKQYKINPDYAIPTYDKDGKKSYNLTNADVKAFVDKNPSTDAFYTWATTNNLSPEQIAAASERPITQINKLFTGAKDLVGEDGKIDQTKVDEKTAADEKANFDYAAYLKANPDVQAELDAGKANFGSKDDLAAAAWEHYQKYGRAQKRPLKAAGGLLAGGGLAALTMAGGGTPEQFNLGGYSDGGRLLRGPGDGVSDSIPATIGDKRPARLADGEFVVPARIVSELGNGSTEAGARKLYAMMDRVQAARKGSIGKGRVANNSRADKYLPA